MRLTLPQEVNAILIAKRAANRITRPYRIDSLGETVKRRYDGFMDWTGCDLIERVPGKMGGRPVIKGTRIEPETILAYEDYGYTPEQTHAEYPTVPAETIRKIRAFAAEHQPA